MKGYTKASLAQTLEIERLLNEHFDRDAPGYRTGYDDDAIAALVAASTKRPISSGARRDGAN